MKKQAVNEEAATTSWLIKRDKEQKDTPEDMYSFGICSCLGNTRLKKGPQWESLLCKIMSDLFTTFDECCSP